MTHEIADQVPPDSPGAREIGFTVPRTLQRQPHPVRQSRARPRRAARADRPRRHAQLCRALRGGFAMGPRLPLARAEARRPHPDVSRRHAGLSRGVLRRGAGGLRAAADQHADAARPAAVLSRRIPAPPWRSPMPSLRSRFNAEACKDTPLQTLIVVNGAAGEHAVPNARRRSDGCGISRPICRKPTPTATRWRSGCTRPARPAGRRASCICSTTWPIASRPLRATCSSSRPDDICFSVPKIFFAYGFGNSITFPFSVGAATLLLPGQPKPAAIFEAIEHFRPSVFFGLPTLYTSLTKADGAAAADFSSLRMALSAAEVLSAEVFNGWKALTGLEIVEGLGSTEALHIYLSNRPEREEARRGRPARARLRNPAQGQGRPRGRRRRGRHFVGARRFQHAAVLEPARQDRPRPSARAAGSTPATVSCATATAFISSAAAPMT